MIVFLANKGHQEIHEIGPGGSLLSLENKFKVDEAELQLEHKIEETSSDSDWNVSNKLIY